jgi:hypothetical protein
MNRNPNIENLEIVFVLWWKIWAIKRPVNPPRTISYRIKKSSYKPVEESQKNRAKNLHKSLPESMIQKKESANGSKGYFGVIAGQIDGLA